MPLHGRGAGRRATAAPASFPHCPPPAASGEPFDAKKLRSAAASGNTGALSACIAAAMGTSDPAAAVNAANEDDETALHLAAGNGDRACVDLLLQVTLWCCACVCVFVVCGCALVCVGAMVGGVYCVPQRLYQDIISFIW